MSRDTLFQSAEQADKSFRFDERVADVFSDMINRSVPGYRESLEGLQAFAAQLLPAGGRCYDLGCSLGAATLAICSGLGGRAATLIGIDNSEAMIDRCHGDARFADREQQVRFVHADIVDAAIADADLIIMHYTLQFIPQAERQNLLARLHNALKPGGALIISEKFVFDDPKIQQFLTEQHLDFKRRNDYSEMEIAGKRAALENVLIAETREAHIARLRAAGFAHVALWQANLNFGSMIAFRAGDND